jgi:hypothetical protein
MKSNSSGSVPKKSGKKYSRYERGSNAQMKNALDKALRRLGDPVVDFRSRRDLIVKRAHKPKDGA